MKLYHCSLFFLSFLSCTVIRVDNNIPVRITESITVDTSLDTTYSLTQKWINIALPYADQIHNDKNLIYFENPKIIIRFLTDKVIFQSSADCVYLIESYKQYIEEQFYSQRLPASLVNGTIRHSSY